MMFYSTQKEVKSYNIGRTFLPLFLGFTDVFSKLSVNQFTKLTYGQFFKTNKNDINYLVYIKLVKIPFKMATHYVKIISSKNKKELP